MATWRRRRGAHGTPPYGSAQAWFDAGAELTASLVGIDHHEAEQRVLAAGFHPEPVPPRTPLRLNADAGRVRLFLDERGTVVKASVG